MRRTEPSEAALQDAIDMWLKGHTFIDIGHKHGLAAVEAAQSFALAYVRAHPAGPAVKIEAVQDERRDRAFQADMLEADQAYADQWMATMRALVAEGLREPEFTRRRMEALRAWEESRRAAQKRLHWKYDQTGRRPSELVRRDIARTLGRLSDGPAGTTTPAS